MSMVLDPDSALRESNEGDNTYPAGTGLSFTVYPRDIREARGSLYCSILPMGLSCTRISNCFGELTVFDGVNKYHTGTDMPAPAGTPVRSLFDGKVLLNATTDSSLADRKHSTAFAKYYNSYVVIQSPNPGLSIYYGHVLSPLANGALVKAGDPIGKVREAYTKQDVRSTETDHLHCSANLKQGEIAPAFGYCTSYPELGTTGWVDILEKIQFTKTAAKPSLISNRIGLAERSKTLR